MSKLGDFDVNELIMQLHNELKFAFEAIQTGDQKIGLRLENVKAKFGRKELDHEAKREEELEVLNGERYPNAEDWELEVTYKHGVPLRDLPQSNTWVTSSDSQLILKRLSRFSIVNIKGISKVWEERFKNFGISTIEELSNASSEKIRRLSTQYHSLAPLEFQTMVLLLVRNINPIAYHEFSIISMLAILQHSQDSLKKLFKGKLSGPEISEIKALASIMYLVLDKAFFRKLKLDLLMK